MGHPSKKPKGRHLDALALDLEGLLPRGAHEGGRGQGGGGGVGWGWPGPCLPGQEGDDVDEGGGGHDVHGALRPRGREVPTACHRVRGAADPQELQHLREGDLACGGAKGGSKRSGGAPNVVFFFSSQTKRSVSNKISDALARTKYFVLHSLICSANTKLAFQCIIF